MPAVRRAAITSAVLCHPVRGLTGGGTSILCCLSVTAASIVEKVLLFSSQAGMLSKVARASARLPFFNVFSRLAIAEWASCVEVKGAASANDSCMLLTSLRHIWMVSSRNTVPSGSLAVMGCVLSKLSFSLSKSRTHCVHPRPSDSY